MSNIPIGNPLIQYNKDTNEWEKLLYIGGSNLLKGTGFDSGLPTDFFNGENSSLDYKESVSSLSGYKMLCTKFNNPNTQYGLFQNLSKLKLIDGYVYCLSFSAKCNSSATLKCLAGVLELKEIEISTEYTRYEVFFKFDSSLYIEDDVFKLSILVDSTDPNSNFSIKNLMFEEGNVSTTWKKASSDVSSISSASSGGYYPGPVTSLNINPGDCSVFITWTDPEDIYCGSINLTNWKGTAIVKKEGSIPQSMNDGDTVVITTERDKYRKTPLVCGGLSNDTEYYFRAFTFTTNYQYQFKVFDECYKSCTPSEKPKIYGFKCTTSNIEKNTLIDNRNNVFEYTYNAIGLSKAYLVNTKLSLGDWENIIPNIVSGVCLFKNGNVNYYLDPNNFTKKLNGEDADITSGNDGDVMIEFSKMAFNIKNDGLSFSISNHQSIFDNTTSYSQLFKNYSKMYVSAFECSILDNKLRSLYGKHPALVSPSTISNYLHSGYSLISFDQYMYIYLLRMLILQNRALTGSINSTYSIPCKTGETMNLDINNYGEINLFSLENFSTNTQTYIYDKEIDQSALPESNFDFANTISILENKGFGLDPTFNPNYKSSLSVKYRKDSKESNVLSFGLNCSGFPTGDPNETTIQFTQTPKSDISTDIGYRMVYMI